MHDSFFVPSDSVISCQKIKEAHRDLSVAIALETQRLTAKYCKDSFDCEDLQQILCVGRDNIRSLMSQDGFPSIQIGNRKIVPAIAFVNWLVCPIVK